MGIKTKARDERTYKVTEFRVIEDNECSPDMPKKKKIMGYASVFNQLSEDLGGFREIVRQGSFTKTLQEADVRALFNHDPNFVLGRNKAGTLRLAEDNTGLKIEIDPPDTQWARDLMTSIDRGDINQMSFGFRIIKDDWTEEKLEDKSIQTIREIREVALYDVSPVTFPAYPQTSLGLRSNESDHLATILLKIDKNLTINENELKLVEKVIDKINDYRSHKNNKIELLKKQLELKYKEAD